ncbi:MAG: hypothetical protein WC332_00685 [Clostridia bacterium]|jgi:hypothetical protein
MKKINNKFIYRGDVKITHDNAKEWADKLKDIQLITGDLSINSNTSLPALKSVGGYLSIYSNASLKADSLKSVGGYLSIYSKIDEKLEKRLWNNNSKNKWNVCDLCSDWLLNQDKDFTYHINDIIFDKNLFTAVRLGNLSAAQVFEIKNMEQRRVAYGKMEKAKMTELPNLKTLDESKDKYGFVQRVISFTVEGFKDAFLFYNCFCPSTGREYYLETKQKTCEAAKAKSFGFNEIEFTEEW